MKLILTSDSQKRPWKRGRDTISNNRLRIDVNVSATRILFD